MLGIKDQETFPLIFYRDNCADMALTPDDISEEYIASSRALAVTGTHLSHANTRAAVLKALEYARRHGLRTALDIDYRPVLWGLTSLGDGETRFIESGPVTSQLQEVLHLFDLVVGTEEEFHIAGGSTDTLTALKNLRNATKATLVCKRGPMGCVVLEGDIPDSWDQVPLQQGVRVEVLNVLGAGDAFMSACCAAGSTTKAGSRLAVTPTPAARWWSPATAARQRCPPKSNSMTTCCAPNRCRARTSTERLNHLHRVTSRRQQWPELCIFAFDHRKQLADLARETGAR
ncbi:5-keto-2-deoxygluconokinase [Klebsiella variicola]|uniref:5-keto-2-deoxygluconokinase n=1 Tax=Klebsiella variicola TaxID=244366 RepID=A0A7H4MCA4_KLEVA|nr:5-keto-2-deoxygluconokinase [Klebsiella variicola]